MNTPFCPWCFGEGYDMETSRNYVSECADGFRCDSCDVLLHPDAWAHAMVWVMRLEGLDVEDYIEEIQACFLLERKATPDPDLP